MGWGVSEAFGGALGLEGDETKGERGEREGEGMKRVG